MRPRRTGSSTGRSAGARRRNGPCAGRLEAHRQRPGYRQSARVRAPAAALFLSDLAGDPGERQNHAAGHPGVVRELRELHEEWASPGGAMRRRRLHRRRCVQEQARNHFATCGSAPWCATGHASPDPVSTVTAGCWVARTTCCPGAQPQEVREERRRPLSTRPAQTSCRFATGTTSCPGHPAAHRLGVGK